MPVLFRLKRFQEVKRKYLEFLKGAKVFQKDQELFESYSLYLENDPEVKEIKKKKNRVEQNSTKKSEMSPIVPSSTSNIPSPKNKFPILYFEYYDKDYEQWKKLTELELYNFVNSEKIKFLSTGQIQRLKSIIDDAIKIEKGHSNYEHFLYGAQLFYDYYEKSGMNEKRPRVEKTKSIRCVREIFSQNVRVDSKEHIDGSNLSTNKYENTYHSNVVIEKKEIEVSWDSVTFYDNKIKIETPNKLKPVLVDCDCRASYNKIKDLLKMTLPKVIIVGSIESGFSIKNQVELDKAIMLIKHKVSEDLFMDNELKSIAQSLSKAFSMKKNDYDLMMKKLGERKQKYINMLIKLHVKTDYKVVPAIEQMSHESSYSCSEEDAFIFTIHNNIPNCLTVVYENTNPARASLVFVVEKRLYTSCIQSIFEFMSDFKIKNKREMIRRHPQIAPNGIVSVHSVNHTENMNDWLYNIRYC